MRCTYTLSDLVNSSWEAEVTWEIAGSDCLRVSLGRECGGFGSLLDHVRDDTIGLPWSSVILGSTIPEDLQGWVSRYSVLVTQRLVLCAVDLEVSTPSNRKVPMGGKRGQRMS
jgi:hypothetical protein